MCVLNYVQDRIGTIKTFQYIFERLGGITWKYWSRDMPVARIPINEVQSDVTEAQNRIREGIQHIKDEAPRGNFDCEQTCWLECELVDPGSKIYGLRRELIATVLKSIKDKDNFATKATYYPVLLPDIRKEFQLIVKQILPRLLTTTLLCIGEAKFGKTPLMTTLAFAMARWHAQREQDSGRVVEPAVRTMMSVEDDLSCHHSNPRLVVILDCSLVSNMSVLRVRWIFSVERLV